MDYFVWGNLEAHTSRRPHTLKASLIVSIKEHFTTLPRDLVIKSCSLFRGRIEAVIEAEINYFKRASRWIINVTFVFYFKLKY